MSLSCYCDDDYDWYYEISEMEFSANKSSKCYGCLEPIVIGDLVAHIDTHKIDEEDEEIAHKTEGRICDKCWNQYQALIALGFCITANVGFIKEAMKEYKELSK